jgi:hypothetical protein
MNLGIKIIDVWTDLLVASRRGGVPPLLLGFALAAHEDLRGILVRLWLPQ